MLLLVVKGVLGLDSSVAFAYDFLIVPVGFVVAGVAELDGSFHVKSRGGLGLGEGGRGADSGVEENNGVFGLVKFCFRLAGSAGAGRGGSFGGSDCCCCGCCCCSCRCCS